MNSDDEAPHTSPEPQERRRDDTDAEGDHVAEEGEYSETPAENGKKRSGKFAPSDQEDEGSGEETARPSAKRVGMYSDEEDSDESDEEMTEADKQFIVDDAEDEEDAPGSDRDTQSPRRRKRKKKRKTIEESESDLDADDLDLLDEATGKGRVFKRLKRKAEEDDVARIFSDEEDVVAGREGMDFHEGQHYNEDDMDDFIINDDEEAEGDADRKILIEKRRKERAVLGQNLGRSMGISDDQWRDAQELFDYEMDYGWAMHQLKSGMDMLHLDENEEEIMAPKQREVKLTDIYEPTEIAEKLLTDADELIRVTDLPERLQLRGDFPAPEPGELETEAIYVAHRIAEEKHVKEIITSDHPLVESIRKVLLFFRGENEKGERFYFEVPFIYGHRKDYIEGQLDIFDLWRVHDLDLQFMTFQAKKRNVTAILKDLAQQSERAAQDLEIQYTLERAMHIEEVQDVQQYLHLKYGHEVAHVEQARRQTFKRSKRKTPYEIARQAGIGQFAKMFHIDVRRIASQNSAEAVVPEMPDEEPIIAAERFVNEPYQNAEEVLEAARMMLAADIAADPSFRAYVRKVYLSDAAIKVTPTKKGKTEIDPQHPYYPFKFLTNKYLFEFTDGQILQILSAEEEGLVTVEMKISAEDLFLRDVYTRGCIQSSNENAFAWNEEIRKILEYSCRELVFPQIVKWQKERLGTRAAEYVALQCQKELEKKISVAGYRRPDEEESHEWDSRVLSITWGDGEPNATTYAAVLKETGEVLQYMKLDRLRGPPEHRGPDIDAIIGLITRHEVDVIAIAGFTPNTKTILHRTLQDIIQEGLVSRRLNDDIRIVFVEDDVARIYMNSKRGIKEFPEESFPPLVRYCISLGRRVQDPTTEFAGLMDLNDDILHLRLHPQQHLIPPEKLKHALEKAFVNVVNTTGVDINLAAQFPHRASTLQFVAGLGPRKAQSFITRIKRTGGRLESRAQLVKKGLCGKRVFMNCASFIRIRSRHFATYETNLDVLDDTRVHPEDYDLARKMAADALDYDDAAGEDEENPSLHVAELMESDDVEKLAHLALDEFAMELERRLNEKKKMTLNDIMKELMAPYNERRKAFTPATTDEIFTMLTHESDESLRESNIVSAQVIRVMDRFLKCRLPSGLDAIIHIRNMPLERTHGPEPILTELYQENTLLQAKVLRVDKEKMSVELSLRDTDRVRLRNTVPVDPRFDRDREDLELDELAAERNIEVRKSKHKQVRVIKHPYFKPMDYKHAQQFLADKPPGTVVIRPSTKGNDHFSITWKVDEDLYQHLGSYMMHVAELQKENEWALGKILNIEGERYHEIDQIIAERIEPAHRRISDMTKHPKFQRKALSDMMRVMEDQCSTTRRSAYGFIIVPDKPCQFMLVYKHPQSRPHQEYVIANHKGYLFRKRAFDTVDGLLKFFKDDEARRANARARGAPAPAPKRAGPPPPGH
ncbi:SH2 domain-containing protein [Phlyctochytrium arcticum]|nr:SH2 domain-containing protein [Phlyctochytrium arcticum]